MSPDGKLAIILTTSGLLLVATAGSRLAIRPEDLAFKDADFRVVPAFVVAIALALLLFKLDLHKILYKNLVPLFAVCVTVGLVFCATVRPSIITNAWSAAGVFWLSLVFLIMALFSVVDHFKTPHRAHPSTQTAEAQPSAGDEATNRADAVTSDWALQVSILCACLAFFSGCLTVAVTSVRLLGSGDISNAIMTLWLGLMATIATSIVVMVGSYLAAFGRVTQAAQATFQSMTSEIAKAEDKVSKAISTAVTGTSSGMNAATESTTLAIQGVVGRVSAATRELQSILAAILTREQVARLPPGTTSQITLDAASRQLVAAVDAAHLGVFAHSPTPTTIPEQKDAPAALPVAAGVLHAYLCESAFDLSRRYLVTNTANYAAATVGAAWNLEAALRSGDGHQRRVLYLTNTVCSPGHLLNWPISVASECYPLRLATDFIFEYMTFMRFFSRHLDRFFHARIVTVQALDLDTPRAKHRWDSPMPPPLDEKKWGLKWSEVLKEEDGYDSRIRDAVPSLHPISIYDVEPRLLSNEDQRQKLLWYLPKRVGSLQERFPFDDWNRRVDALREHYARDPKREGTGRPDVALALWNLGSGDKPLLDFPEGSDSPCSGCNCQTPSKGAAAECLSVLVKQAALVDRAAAKHASHWRTPEDALEAYIEQARALHEQAPSKSRAVAEKLLRTCEQIDRIKWTFPCALSADLARLKQCLLVLVNGQLSRCESPFPPSGNDFLDWFAETFHSVPDGGLFLEPRRLEKAATSADKRWLSGVAEIDAELRTASRGFRREFAIVGVLRSPQGAVSADRPSRRIVADALGRAAIAADRTPKGRPLLDTWEIEDLVWIETTAEAPWRVAEVSWKTHSETDAQQIGSRERALMFAYARALETAAPPPGRPADEPALLMREK